MKDGIRRFPSFLAALIAFFAWISVVSASAKEEGVYIVQRGDTLYSIAAHFRVTPSKLAAVNGLHPDSWVYIGERLKIPGQTSRSTKATSHTASAATSITYIVRPGDTLGSIAKHYSISVKQLADTNKLRRKSWVYIGQQLKIPRRAKAGAPPAYQQSSKKIITSEQNLSGTKWIDINLSAQILTAYVGVTPVFQTMVSTGKKAFPTIQGNFSIYAKYHSARMQRYNYDIQNVPYVMYFYGSYGLHGAFWHNNFGAPMSHGCINLSVPDAELIYKWAPIGTQIVTHH